MNSSAPSLPDALREELLARVRACRQEAVSLRGDDELHRAWEKALNYYKGEMPEIAALEGRSQAVSTDISDAVEALLPDLMEIFIGGDDVATFSPIGEEDEAAARQETDFVNHVVMQQNDGFGTFYTAFKDALLCKIGVFKAWREDGEAREEIAVTGKTAVELQIADQDGWRIEAPAISAAAGFAPAGTPSEPLYDALLVRARPRSRVRVRPVAPENFAFARDAVKIGEAAYCCETSFPRAQDLIAEGYDAAAVAELPAWTGPGGEGLDQARDTAGESDHVSEGSGPTFDLRQVEIVDHYVRVLEGGRLRLFQVVTGAEETVLLDAREVERIPYSTITPYPVTHRLLGRSVADLLAQVQEIRTVLTRLMLDSGYFAINQRHEIAEDQIGETTVADYLDNRPNRPVLSKTGAALRPIAAAGLSFDAFAALEYTATLAEQRTGVVRNAQGLNPDTLHATKGGAQMLHNAAQKRVRMIARIFAETGVKDLFLNVHALLREGPAQPAAARLRGELVALDPSAWDVREDMDIEIGVGSGGREHNVALMRMVGQLQAQVVAGQGGPGGPMVTPKNIYNGIRRTLQAAGVKSVEPFFSDPAKAMAASGPPAPPAPNPAVVQAQQALALKQQGMEADMALKRRRAELEAQLKREQLAMEFDLKRDQMALQARMDGAPGDRVRFGGDVG